MKQNFWLKTRNDGVVEALSDVLGVGSPTVIARYDSKIEAIKDIVAEFGKVRDADTVEQFSVEIKFHHNA